MRKSNSSGRWIEMYLYQDKQGSFRASSVPCVWMRVRVCVMTLFHSRSLNLYMYCICLSFCHFLSCFLFTWRSLPFPMLDPPCLEMKQKVKALHATRHYNPILFSPMHRYTHNPPCSDLYGYLTWNSIACAHELRNSNRKCRCSQDKCWKLGSSPLLHTRAAAVLFIYYVCILHWDSSAAYMYTQRIVLRFKMHIYLHQQVGIQLDVAWSCTRGVEIACAQRRHSDSSFPHDILWKKRWQWDDKEIDIQIVSKSTMTNLLI